MRNIQKFVIEVIAPTLLVCWIAYFLLAALSGESGFDAARAIESEVEQKAQRVAKLTERRQYLQRRAAMLNPQGLDPDLVDERIRSVLGFVDESDIVLPREELERLQRVNDQK